MTKQPQDDEAVQELLWQIEYSRKAARAAGKISLWALFAFIVMVLLIVPFLEGFPWHQRWESFGKHLLALTSVPFMASIYAISQFAVRWQLTQDFRKELKQLLEDRYQLAGDQRKIDFGV